ncbi:MAG: hypothetical protein IT162_12260 [Bryobacterales bacterium]|nr:hypothetical protein [Bryobacterales bacterium]
MLACRAAAVLFCAAAFAAEADRTAAEWTLLHNGRVALDGSPRLIAGVEQLPAGHNFTLTMVDWVGVNAVPEDLARLAGLTALRELRLPGPLWNRNADSGKNLSGEMRHLARLGTLQRITFSDHFLDRIRFTDEGLLAIGGLDNLREITLRQAEVKGRGLKPFTLLEALDIELCPVNDEGFAAVGNMKRLRRLRAANTLITSAAMERLTALADLEDLDVSGTEIDDAGVQHLAGLKHLRRLHLAGTHITDESIEIIARLPALEELSLYRTKVTNAGLRRLRAARALRSVDARYSRASAAGVAELAAGGRIRVVFSAPPAAASAPAPPAGSKAAAVVEWIRRVGGTVSADGAAVSLRGTPVNDTSAAALGALGRTVRKLDLSGTEVGDAGLGAVLARLTAIEELQLGATGVTDKGLAALPATLRRLVLDNTYVEGGGLPTLRALEELDLLGAPVNDEGLEAIAKSAPALRRLHLGETDVTGPGLDVLASLPRLAHLDLAATDVGNEGLRQLAKVSSLRFLRLRETRLTQSGLAYLAPLAATLEVLDLGRNTISSEGLAHVAKLTALRTLVLEYAEMDDENFKALAALTGLRELNLDSTHITDASVAQLAGYASLERLNLYHTFVSAEGVARLRQARPSCRIVWDPLSSVNNRRRA